MVDFPETPRSHPDDTLEKLFPTSVLSKILNPSTGAKQLEATVLKTINAATKCIWFVLPATLDAPSTISNASSAISDIPFQMPDATSAILNAPFEMQGASFAILDVPFEMQDAPSATQDAPFEMQDASFEMQDASFAISNAPSSMAKMASQMPKTSKNEVFAPAAMGNGENGVFWPAPALTGKSRPADFQWDGGRCSIWGKARRADIFVAWRSKNEPSSVGATSWWPSARTIDDECFHWAVLFMLHTSFFAMCSSRISCTVRATMTLWLRLNCRRATVEISQTRSVWI